MIIAVCKLTCVDNFWRATKIDHFSVFIECYECGKLSMIEAKKINRVLFEYAIQWLIVS